MCVRLWEYVRTYLRIILQPHCLCYGVLCAVYEQSEKLCKEYGKVKGAGTIARPERHPFFQGLSPLLRLHLDKAERENGFM